MLRGSKDRVCKIQGFVTCDNVQQIGLAKSQFEGFFLAKQFTSLLLVRVLAFSVSETLPPFNESLNNDTWPVDTFLFTPKLFRVHFSRRLEIIRRALNRGHFLFGHANTSRSVPRCHDFFFERKSEGNKQVFNSVVFACVVVC